MLQEMPLIIKSSGSDQRQQDFPSKITVWFYSKIKKGRELKQLYPLL
jgi:hypothetical protein